MQKKLSIISINYNNKEGLEQTINSVINQSYKDFEYIIIDGNSSDGSKEVLEKYKDNIDFALSEKDTGVYNAMNKGILNSKADYVVFLNSGDTFIDDNSLAFLIENIDSNAEIIYSELNYIFPSGEQKIVSYPGVVDFQYFLSDTIPHPGTLISRKLFLDYGLYDETMRICSDWAFFMKVICKFDIKYKFLRKPIVNYTFDGMSSDPKNRSIILKEKKDYIAAEFSKFTSLINTLDSYEKKITSVNKSKAVKALKKLGFLRYI